MNIKILVVGDSSYYIYAPSIYQALKDLENISAEYFDFGRLNVDFKGRNLLEKIEHHYHRGYHVAKLNDTLSCKCESEKFNIVFLFSARFVYGRTVNKIKHTGAYIAMYSNDDPFSSYYKNYAWRNYMSSLKYADMVYAYRKRNVEDYRARGVKNIGLLLPYYCKSKDYYIDDGDITEDIPSVVFMGHFENDERKEYLESLIAAGVRVGISDKWGNVECEVKGAVKLNGKPELYNRIINKAKIAIVFLSKINGDSYTRRCFEIPAVKTMMIAPYTDDLSEMFKENEEIVFYRDKRDFVDKIQYYLTHEDERISIAEAGYRRLKKDGHEVGDRAKIIIRDYLNWKGEIR